MMQGFVCHARGVELPVCGASRVHARVRSKRVHDVHLLAERGRLLVACSCPAQSLGVDACKHAWAALLEVDRQDGLKDVRDIKGFLVVEAASVEPPPRPPVKAPRDGLAPEQRQPRRQERNERTETAAALARTKTAAKPGTKPKAAPETKPQTEARPQPQTKSKRAPKGGPARAARSVRAR
jgi:hypothetical protein